jgi:hypothetical protein
MKLFLSCILFGLLACLPQSSFVKAQVGGGANCAACTIVVSLLDQVAVIRDQQIGWYTLYYGP